MRTVRLAVLTLILAGCATPRHPATRGLEFPDQMIEAVQKKIPIGTPTDQAQRLMERDGFRCVTETGASFAGRDGVDILRCERNEWVGFQRSRTWTVGLVQREGKVAEILAQTWVNGQ
jgi:hypothetical protein